jgi:hypothetical protein
MDVSKLNVNGVQKDIYELLQQTGQSVTSAMSQKAVTDIMMTISKGDLIQPNEVLPGFLNLNGYYSTSNTGNTHKYLCADIKNNIVYITGRSRNTQAPYYPVASFFDENNHIIDIYGNDGKTYIDEKITIPTGTSYFYVTNGPEQTTSCKESIEIAKFATIENVNNLQNQLSLEESVRQQGDINTLNQAKDYANSMFAYEEEY